MELRQLKYFIRVAECLNFSEAAKESCISQSTLSQQIKQLEQELGSELFLRNSRTVSLTEAGMELLPYARTTIKDADACIERIRDLKDILTGTMNIGVTYSFSPILTETIFSFIKKYPKVKLNIFYKPMSELMDMLRDRKVDFVLAFKPSAPMEGIESHILFQNYLAAIVSSTHSLASEKKVSLEQIAQHGIALPSKGLQARNMLDKVLERYNFNLKARIELNDPDILLNLVRQSNLVTVLAEASIHNERGVKAVPIDIPDNEMVGCVHTLEDSYRKHSMLEFIKMLCESVAVRERINSWL
jgi:LysR family cyn operon transcriptional activator